MALNGFCFTGGGQPFLRHGWVWFPEQCDAMPMQVRRSTGLPVWMSCRYRGKTFSEYTPLICQFQYFNICQLIFQLISLVSFRRCLQCRGGGFIWPPTPDLQQLPVNEGTTWLKAEQVYSSPHLSVRGTRLNDNDIPVNRQMIRGKRTVGNWNDMERTWIWFQWLITISSDCSGSKVKEIRG